MIGQEKLLERLSKFNYETFPQTSLFVGDVGCGKRTLVKELSNKFNVQTKDITNDISNDTILDSYITSLPVIYVINIQEATQLKRIINLQNSILKFIEEPPTQSKIILLITNLSQLLPTIKNRCQIFTFSSYSTSQLIEYSKVYNSTRTDESTHEIPILDDPLYTIYNTPGKLLMLTSSSHISEVLSLIDNIINNVNKATLSNVLTICDKLDFGDGGINLDIFIAMMRMRLVEKLSSTPDFYRLKQYYMSTVELSTNLMILGVNKKLLVEHYLIKLKSIV